MLRGRKLLLNFRDALPVVKITSGGGTLKTVRRIGKERHDLSGKLIDLIVGHFIRIAGIQVDAGGDHVGYPFGNGWPFHVYLSIGRTDTPVAEKETGTVVDPVVVSTVVAAVFSMLPFQKFLPFLGIRIPDEKGEHIQP